MGNSVAAKKTSTEPKFKWVFYSLDMRWELREIGHTHSFATIYSLRHTDAVKAGYSYSLYVAGAQFAHFKSSQEAADFALEYTAEARAAQNTVAWAAAKPVRQAQARAEEQERVRLAEAAKKTSRAKRDVMRVALDQFVANQGEYIEDQGDEATEEERAQFALAEQMLEELNAELCVIVDR